MEGLLAALYRGPHHEAGYEGLDWQADEYSRARAASALAGTVQSRMAKASVARVMERAMTEGGV